MTAGYNGLREAAAWLDLSPFCKLLLTGADAGRLLHAITTQHILELRPGEGSYAFFLNAQGQILADAHVFRRERDYLVISEPEFRDFLKNHLDKYIVADDVGVEDLTDEMVLVALEGPGSRSAMESLAGRVPGRRYEHFAWKNRVLARADVTGNGGFWILAFREESEKVFKELASSGLPSATREEAEVVRLERGRPRVKPDMEGRLPQETQVLYAVRFDKGCYLGQEIVERVRSRGKVKRVLVPIVGPGLIETGEFEGGRITSSAFSPGMGKGVALGYVPVESATPGKEIRIRGVNCWVQEPYRPD